MNLSSGRLRHLREGAFQGESVLYWMVRDKRVYDNWALIEAQKIALKNKVGHLITDFSPLKVYTNRLKKVLDKTEVPILQVDAHNIVPAWVTSCLLYTSPSPRDRQKSRMPSSA